MDTGWKTNTYKQTLKVPEIGSVRGDGGSQNNATAITDTVLQVHANLRGDSRIVLSQYVNWAGVAPEMNQWYSGF